MPWSSRKIPHIGPPGHRKALHMYRDGVATPQVWPVIPTAKGGPAGPPGPAAYSGPSAQPSPAVEPVADLCELPAESDSRLVLAGAPFFPGLAGGVVDPGQGDAAVAC